MLANEGTGGNTSTQLVARLQADVIAVAPTYCLGLIGANDAAAGVGSATVIANLTSMFDDLTAAGIKIIWGTVLPRTGVSDPAESETITGTNAWLRANLETGWPGSKLVDWSAAMSENDDETDPIDALFSDGVHPNAAGVLVMAGVLDDVLATL